MPKVPGKCDGEKMDDLRLYHLSVPHIMWYAKNGDFEKITKIRTISTDKQDVISVTLENPIRRHTWRGHEITEIRYGTAHKINVALPRIPARYERRWTQMTHEEIYELAEHIKASGTYTAPPCAECKSTTHGTREHLDRARTNYE